ncbi:MAG: Mn transporter [Acidobacteria bacterium RIFCSPLOWO2_12_FULL_59_11]|nr:MAG: Mn transporter [Acidobacteria bacterium RIFCSPLOWO2_12_FULL_59_11]
MNLLKRWKVRILIFLAVVGPGFITANVDNDAGGIYTYSLAGARYGYSLLWTLLPITLVLIVVQEMSSRLGAVTGKGLADLIREEFGFRTTFFVMLALTVANLFNVMAEFAGVASSMEIFGVPKYLSVPVVAVFVWLLVVRGTYKSVEKVFLAACSFYVCYVVSGIMAKPDWLLAAQSTFRPTFQLESGYLVMLVGIIGATVAPWMQFYLQSAIVEKGVEQKQYAESRVEVIVGCIVTNVVAFFIVVSCAATLHMAGTHNIADAADAAVALRPLAGEYASVLFALGLFNASVFAASILPLATAYSVCEGLGFEAGVNKKFREAPVFYWLYTLLIGIGAGLILIPSMPLIFVSYFSQVANGFLLPFVLLFMLSLVNRTDLMGRFKNSRGYNLVAGSTVVFLVVLTFLLLALQFSGTQ